MENDKALDTLPSFSDNNFTPEQIETLKTVLENKKKEIADKEQIKKNIEEEKNLINVKFEKEQIKIKDSIWNIYKIMALLFFALGVANIAIFVFKANIFLIILSLVISIPIAVCMLIYLVVRLWIFDDISVLKGNIITRISSNYIIANFFLTQKRILKRVALLNNDGISFDMKNHTCVYTIDSSAVWLDEENRPNAFYVPNLPNPLKFDFVAYLKKALEAYRKKDLQVFDDKLDVIYSSENLKRMKQDDYLQKMHKDTSKDMQKMFTYFMIMFALTLIIIGVIVYVLGHKSTIIQMGENVTGNIHPNIV